MEDKIFPFVSRVRKFKLPFNLYNESKSFWFFSTFSPSITYIFFKIPSIGDFKVCIPKPEITSPLSSVISSVLIKNNEGLAISKALAYSEYADVIWCETNTPDLGFAKEFADEIKNHFPKKILAYNCSPSFNWMNKFSKSEIENFQLTLFELGYKLQFVSLAGFHSMVSSMYDLASKYKGGNMSAIVELQKFENNLTKEGYTGIKHQQEVGGDYYEKIGEALLGDDSELLSKKDSTENTQF